MEREKEKEDVTENREFGTEGRKKRQNKCAVDIEAVATKEMTR